MGKFIFVKTFLPMKKHLVFSAFFALAAIITVEAQSLTYSGAQSPTDAAQKVRQAASIAQRFQQP
jgi:hypothetical protein